MIGKKNIDWGEYYLFFMYYNNYGVLNSFVAKQNELLWTVGKRR